MRFKFFLFFAFNVCMHYQGIAQIDQRTINIIKLTMLQEAILVDGIELSIEKIVKFYECDYDITQMKSIGLFPFKFYKVKAKYCSSSTEITAPKILRSSVKCSTFIVGIHHSLNKIYRIHGFTVNEFDEFLNNWNDYAEQHQNVKITSKKKMNRMISVEDLDLDCLYDFSREKNVTKWDEYDCFRNHCFSNIINH